MTERWVRGAIGNAIALLLAAPAIVAAQAFPSRALRMYPVSATIFQTAIAA